MDEFGLIRKYFSALAPQRADVALGIGDDAALLLPPPGEQLAVTTDTLVAGRHFLDSVSPYDLGWKALAVNLSDLAAMGAEPRWFFLALTLPEADPAWLEGFASGLGALAELHNLTLAGGDTTRGPLSITITAIGSVPPAQALRRSGARLGDRICVTGTLGDAALALSLSQGGAPRRGQEQALANRLDRPVPRVGMGLALRGLATAAIDLSDGLAGDLAHVLAASGLGAEINVDALPTSPAFARLAPADQRLVLQLAGGDDYELCVFIPPALLDEARRRGPLTEVGRVTEAPGLRYVDGRGQSMSLELTGYKHF